MPPITENERKWKEAANHPERRLLRLAVLRDVYRDVHARISQQGAGPGHASPLDDTLALRILQPCLEALRDSRKLPDDWNDIFRPSTSPAAPPRAEPLPDPMLQAFGRERILRYDRKWEAALAAEARAAGWAFWTATRELRLPDVGAVNDRLISELWPRGICLFCEPAPQGPGEPEARDGYWRGRWWLTIHPDITAPGTSDFERSCFARVSLDG